MTAWKAVERDSLEGCPTGLGHGRALTLCDGQLA